MENRGMRTAIWIFLLLTVATACASGPSKADLDAEVRRLCAIDGGVRVYETVRVTEAMLDRSGILKIPIKKDAQKGDAYYYEWNVQYLKHGNPEDGGTDLARSHFKIYRATDSKLIGESIAYTRRGGDVPGPWHPSHFTCPSDSGLTTLQNRVFIRSSLGDVK
jgi:hypothetical protein